MKEVTASRLFIDRVLILNYVCKSPNVFTVLKIVTIELQVEILLKSNLIACPQIPVDYFTLVKNPIVSNCIY